jgi:hypothetical protein
MRIAMKTPASGMSARIMPTIDAPAPIALRKYAARTKKSSTRTPDSQIGAARPTLDGTDTGTDAGSVPTGGMAAP